MFWFRPIATGVVFLANVRLMAATMWLLVGAVAAVEGWLKLGHTNAFRGSDGHVLTGSSPLSTGINAAGANRSLATFRACR